MTATNESSEMHLPIVQRPSKWSFLIAIPQSLANLQQQSPDTLFQSIWRLEMTVKTTNNNNHNKGYHNNDRGFPFQSENVATLWILNWTQAGLRKELKGQNKKKH